MKTYQDFLTYKETEYGKFCKDAVDTFRSSSDYITAKDGESYYAKHNITIEKWQKYLYTVSGNIQPDIFSANYKLKTLFFRRLVTQQVQYVLGNGITIENKDKLGKDFDYKVQKAAKHAMAAGRSFLFWNLDHLEVFCYADTPIEPGFCPIHDENTSQLMGGVRFWYKQYNNDIIWHYTLYLPDGYMEFITDKDQIVLTAPKRAYKITETKTEIDGVIDEIESNYETLPIVPLYANDTHESELVGIRESIDCYDFIKSGLGNDIDDTSGFYWIIKNAGGMDDPDLARFVQKMKTVRAASVGDDIDVDMHTVDVPVEARKTMLEILRKDIYEDFQALDVNTLSAAQKTTQEIQAAYQSQDNKCADFEYMIVQALEQILKFTGIDDEITLNWMKVVNQTEQTQMLLMVANYLSEETIIRHLPFLTPEEAEDEIAKLDEREARRYAEALEEEDETRTTKEDTASESGIRTVDVDTGA